MDKPSVIKTAAEFYLQSPDFNGIPIGDLAHRVDATCDQVSELLRQLVHDDEITVLGASSGNSHILRTGIPDNTRQLETLESPDIHHTCIYVRPDALAEFVADDLYAAEPYKRELALGAVQLSFRAFDLMVLEHYRNDPRYRYQNSDIDGRICISDDYYESTDMAESDKVLLQTFGFAYDDDMNLRPVCRGGNYFDVPGNARCAVRLGLKSPSYSDSRDGFRICLGVPRGETSAIRAVP